MFEGLLIGTLVLLATGHALWHVLPGVWRQQIAARLAGAGASETATNAQIGWRALLQRLAGAPAAGCTDCGGRARCPAQSAPEQRQPLTYPLIASSRG